MNSTHSPINFWERTRNANLVNEIGWGNASLFRSAIAVAIHYAICTHIRRQIGWEEQKILGNPSLSLSVMVITILSSIRIWQSRWTLPKQYCVVGRRAPHYWRLGQVGWGMNPHFLEETFSLLPLGHFRCSLQSEQNPWLSGRTFQPWLDEGDHCRCCCRMADSM